MYQSAALFLAASLLLGPPAAFAQEADPAACHAAYRSGATYGEGAVVSAAKTIEATSQVACTFGADDPDCPAATCSGEGTEESPYAGCTKTVAEDVAVACNYECFSDAWCSNDGYAPPGVNHVNPAFSVYAWTELDCPCDDSETATPPTLAAPPAWDSGGCPSAFSAAEEYGAGDAVSVCSADPSQPWCLVYQCKSATPAPGKFCDMAGYEPGSSLHWAQAWTLEGSCSGTVGPTASPSFDPANSAGGCPGAFDVEASYGAGDAVSVGNAVFECKDGAYAAACGQPGYAPLNEDHADAWPLAWEHKGWCAGTIAPTSSPNYEALEDVGGCPGGWEEGDYAEGDRVSANGLVFECKGWPMGAHCGQPGHAPLVDDAAPDAWTVAWTVVGHCSGTRGPSASPTFDALVADIDGCPAEYSSEKDDYQGGEQVTLTVSEDPERKLVYECKAYPYVGYCNQHGPFAPGEQYASMAWTLVGACTGTLAPTTSPTPYGGTCLYDRCRTVETTEACEVNLDDPNNANCPKASCACTTTSVTNEDETVTVTETCTGCERTFDEEQCTPTQVDNWAQFTAPADLYQAGDVVRVGTTKYYCVDGNAVNCNSPSHQPEDASGLWLYYGIWVADGECPAAGGGGERRLRGRK